MDRGLIITKELLKYRNNILKMEEMDVLIFDLDAAIDELKYAFQENLQREFDLKYINKIINFAKNENIGLGEGFIRIVKNLNFPFWRKSLFAKKVLINNLNGGMEKIEKFDHFDLNNLLTVLFEDQKKVDELDIYDLGKYLREG